MTLMQDMTDRLAEIAVRPGRHMESQSGLQNANPRIWGRFVAPASAWTTAAIITHPTSNFMGHYLLRPLAERGLAVLALNTRYAGNDMMLLMEHVIRDIGAGVNWLLEAGARKTVFIGNSGGAAVGAFYQGQAETLDAKVGADGKPIELNADSLPPFHGVVLTAAHAGRSRLLEEWLDPSVIDENDPLSADPSLDIYNADIRPPYSTEFVAAFRRAQKERRDSIERRVVARLRQLEAHPNGPQDEAFIVHRTHADPRFFDLTIDANDRPVGSIWGDPRAVNYGANAMGRVTTLRSWLSQWSSRSLADGPTNLRKTSVPVLLHRHTADGSTFPSTHRLWTEAAGDRIRVRDIPRGTHYLHNQPDLITLSADSIADWVRDQVET